MPLNYSGSKQATDDNYRELYAKLQKTEEIHGYHPPNKEKASKYISAIVYAARKKKG